MSEGTEPKLTNDYFTFDDVMEARKNGAQGLKLKPYDPFQFWENMGQKWYKTFDKREKFLSNVPWIVDRLKQFKVDNLLDVGTGFARILPFLLDEKVIGSGFGIDISPTILKDAELWLDPTPKNNTDADILQGVVNADGLPDETKARLNAIVGRLREMDGKRAVINDFRDRITLKVGDARAMEFADNSFDAVLTCEVLQHLEPKDAEKACSEMARVTKKLVICAERWAYPGEREPHIWSHDISDMFSKLGLKVIQSSAILPSIVGVVAVKT